MSPTERVPRSSTKCSLCRWRAVDRVMQNGVLWIPKRVLLDRCVRSVLDLRLRTSRPLRHQALIRSRTGRIPDTFGKKTVRGAGRAFSGGRFAPLAWSASGNAGTRSRPETGLTNRLESVRILVTFNPAYDQMARAIHFKCTSRCIKAARIIAAYSPESETQRLRCASIARTSRSHAKSEWLATRSASKARHPSSAWMLASKSRRFSMSGSRLSPSASIVTVPR